MLGTYRKSGAHNLGPLCLSSEPTLGSSVLLLSAGWLSRYMDLFMLHGAEPGRHRAARTRQRRIWTLGVSELPTHGQEQQLRLCLVLDRGEQQPGTYQR